jgi:tetratricopeptide (TPR) repeat protein
MKDYTGAFSDYTKAIDLKENFVKAWINRANVLLKQERYADAIEDYTAALIYIPDSAPAYYNRAIARYRLNKYTEACEDLKKAEALGLKAEAKLKDKICVTK